MSGLPRFHIALVHPEIGPNAGNAGRLCLGVGARLHLVHPLGFRTDEKAVRRAGLDYWKHVDVQEHESLDAFLGWAESEARPLHLFSARATRSYKRIPYARGDIFVFGRESVGLPPELVSRFGAWSIPIPGEIRSLNLSNAVSVVAYAALEALEPELFA